MPKLKVYSYRNQVDHYPLGDGGTLTIVPGPNLFDEAELKAALDATTGNPTGLRARIKAGEYEVRTFQVATK